MIRAAALAVLALALAGCHTLEECCVRCPPQVVTVEIPVWTAPEFEPLPERPELTAAAVDQEELAEDWGVLFRALAEDLGALLVYVAQVEDLYLDLVKAAEDPAPADPPPP